MSRAIDQAHAAADALQAWLESQARRPAGESGELTRRSVAAADRSAPTATRRRRRAADGATNAPVPLPHTDWLAHRLRITGPDGALSAFKLSATGAGVIPWQLDHERMSEDWFHLLLAPPTPQQRTLSAAGARILAGQLCEAMLLRQQLAVARVGHTRACPFDLQALLPVPEAILRLGPDHPDALMWLWEQWGTTQPLRHVTEITRLDGSYVAGQPAAWRLGFWSADWTPWRALAQLSDLWPTLVFETRPIYGDAP